MRGEYLIDFTQALVRYLPKRQADLLDPGIQRSVVREVAGVRHLAHNTLAQAGQFAAHPPVVRLEIRVVGMPGVDVAATSVDDQWHGVGTEGLLHLPGPGAGPIRRRGQEGLPVSIRIDRVTRVVQEKGQRLSIHILDAAHAHLRVYRSFQVAHLRYPEGLLLPALWPGHDYGAVPAYAAPVESQVTRHAATQPDARGF